MKHHLTDTLSYEISSDVFDRKFGQAVCFAGGVLVLALSLWKIQRLNLTETQLFFAALVSLTTPLLLIIVGLMLRISTTALAAPPAALSLSDVPHLTAALKRGDERAFEFLHDQWSQRINRLCFALAAGDESVARKIAQATWQRLIRHARVLPDQEALWNWIECAATRASSLDKLQSPRP